MTSIYKRKILFVQVFSTCWNVSGPWEHQQVLSALLSSIWCLHPCAVVPRPRSCTSAPGLALSPCPSCTQPSALLLLSCSQTYLTAWDLCREHQTCSAISFGCCRTAAFAGKNTALPCSPSLAEHPFLASPWQPAWWLLYKKSKLL